jgi:hypothetical protein
LIEAAVHYLDQATFPEGHDICQHGLVDKAARFDGKAVFYRADNINCLVETDLFLQGAAIVFQVRESASDQNDCCRTRDPPVTIPLLNIDTQTFDDVQAFVAAGGGADTTVQFSGPDDECDLQWAPHIKLGNGLTGACCAAADVVHADSLYSFDYLGAGVADFPTCTQSSADGDFDVTCAPLETCSNACASANNTVCEDGGDGSTSSACELGADCADCGPRFELHGRPAEDTVNRAREYFCAADHKHCMPSVMNAYLPQWGLDSATALWETYLDERSGSAWEPAQCQVIVVQPLHPITLIMFHPL